ncbi:hypothetical protein ACJQWK_03937 [Exserohilum turcicum]
MQDWALMPIRSVYIERSTRALSLVADYPYNRGLQLLQGTLPLLPFALADPLGGSALSSPKALALSRLPQHPGRFCITKRATNATSWKPFGLGKTRAAACTSVGAWFANCMCMSLPSEVFCAE